MLKGIIQQVRDRLKCRISDDGHSLGGRAARSSLTSVIFLAAMLSGTDAVKATPFTMTSPDGTALPTAYPEAGGVAMILYGANGNIYYQFSDRAGAFRGFQNNGQPAAFRGNPFTINDPLTLDCGIQTCTDYFGGSIARMEVRFTALDGDTQPGGFDEDDISLLINGVNIGNWSDIPTQNTNTQGTVAFSSGTGFGNNTFDTGWFATNNAVLLNDILTTETIATQVLDDDPNDNFWDFRRGGDLSDPSLERISPAYTLEKRARSGSFTGPDTATYVAGQTIYYTYDIRNVGNVAIDDLEVDDDQLGIVSCAPSSIDTGETAICQQSYTIQQSDIDNGTITNIARATGDPAFGQLGTLSDTVTITGPTADPSLTIEKTPDGSTFGNAGTNFAYDFEVTNDGNVTLTSVTVSDPLIPGLSCSTASLAPGDTLNCTGNYTITQTDVDNGSITNTATAEGRDPSNALISETDSATNTANVTPAFSVIKATSSTPMEEGDTLDYTFTLSNDGNVTISTIALSDPQCAAAPTLTSGDTDSDGDLDVGETHVYSCTSVGVTQAQVDSGSVDNTVTVSGTPAGGALPNATDSISTPIAPMASYTLDKSTASTPTMAGDTLTYSFAVENTGNVTISSVAVADAKCAATPTLTAESITANGLLDVGETQTYECTSIAVTQAEVDAGEVSNTATVTGNTPGGPAVPPVTDSVDTPIARTADSTVLKGNDTTPTAAGQTIDYTFTVANTGNVTLTGISLSDPKCATAVTLASGDTDGDSALDVGETHIYECTSIPVTQAEVDAGQVDNTVSVTATSPTGAVGPETDDHTVTVTAAPALTLDKRLNAASPTSYDSVGDVLLYDFVVTNTGNVSITSAISITDPDLDAAASCPPLPGGSLAPGASITCTGQATMDQGDIDNGSFANTATATDGTTTSPSDTVTVTADQNPSLNTAKSATLVGPFADGSTINYTYTITNDGNTTFPDTTPITVNDSRTTVACDPIPAGGLIPGATLSCTATDTVTAADLDLGSVTNTASATDGTTTSPTTSATVPPGVAPALSVTKTPQAPATFAEAGDTITYAYEVQNTGGAGFTDTIRVTDDRINGGVAFDCWVPSGPTDSFAPDPNYPATNDGETFTCFNTYTVTQTDVDAGSVTNEAVADTIFAPGGSATPVASDPVTATVTGASDAELTIGKTASAPAPTPVAPGSVITYDFTAENTGDVTLTDVAISDPGPTFDGAAGTGTLSAITVITGTDANTDGRADSLAPGETATFRTTYTLTQADIDAAAGAADPATAIANTANGTAVPATGTLSPVTPATATTGFTPAPAFTVSKTTTSTPTAAGDTLDYRFFIDNTGNVAISGITVADAKCAAAPTLIAGDLDSDTVLDVDEIHEYSCTSIPVTQAEVDAGQVDNDVTVSGTPSGGMLTDATDSLSTPITAAAGFDLVKSLVSAAPTEAGDTLTYDFALDNTGNVSILTPAVSDAKCAAVPALQSGDTDGDGQLDPDETFIYRCTSIPVTQAEIDAGRVDNTASASGNEPGGPALPVDQSSLSTPVAEDGEISVTKATTDTPTAAGQTLDYTFTVENDGNVSVQTVSVNDPKCAATPVLQAGSDANSDGRLNPTETWTYTCTSIPVTQAEIDAGTVSNTVTVTSRTPSGAIVPPASDTLDTPTAATPSWTMSKSTTSTPTAAGDTLDYSFEVENTGDVSISAVSVTDAKCAAAPVLTAATDVFGDGILSPGETWTYTCTSIAVTQAEVDAGQVDNSATASGTPSTGTLPDAPASNSTAISSSPMIAVAKSTASTPTAAGDTLDYTFVVTNSGNTSVNTVAVTDANCAAAPVLQPGSDTNSDSALNPTETWTYICTSIPVTQAQVDAGEVSNTVNVTAEDPSGGAVPPATQTIVTPITPSGDFSVVKSTTSTPAAAGDTLDYTFTVSNDGNVSIDNIVVTDAKCAAAPVLQAGSDANSDGSLNPTETWVYTCTSIPVTQAEVDAGQVDNSVSVSGDDPSGTPLTPATDDNSTSIFPAPGLEVLKTITSSATTVGSTVTFEITAENTGNVTLTGVSVADTLLRLDATPLTLATGPTFASASAGSPAGTLQPDETATYTASYVLTQDDIDAGGISNSATVTGTPPTGSPVSDVSDDGIPGNGDDNPTELPITATPEISLAKTLAQVTNPDSSTASSYDAVGDRLDYEFEITNDGNVTLTGPFSITDPLIIDAGGSVICPATPIAPGDSLICTGSYTITQADLDAGQVDNSATATDGTTTSPPSTTSTPAVQSPELSTTKTADPIAPADFVVGATITYTYVVTNEGNTTITDPITISDNLITDPADITCPAWPGTLAPGGTYTCTGTYTVTADDVDLAQATNLATSTDGTTTSPPVSETVPSGAVPALSITKTSPDTSFAAVGDTLTYNFEVENTGTQAFVSDVTVEDDRIGSITCFTANPPTDPDFTAGETVTCSAPYTVTQADIDAGSVTNNAFASTTFGSGTNVVSDPVDLTIDVTANPLLSLDKTVALPAGRTTATLVPGDVLTYTLTATNDGNQTLNAITVSDPLLGLSCSIATLAPTASDASCTGTLTIQQSDIDRGQIDNAASATGSDPSGGTVTATDTLSTPMPAAAPSLSLVKSTSPATFGAVGSTLVYTFTVTNDGNVTITDAVVTDPLIPTFTCTIASLAPGATDATCTATYTVTQDDVDRGDLTNTASVTGDDPSGGDVTTTGSVTTPGPASTPDLEATKTLSTTGTAVGDVVTFTITVANTGNVSLSAVTPTDTLTRNDGTVLTLDSGPTFTGGDTDSDSELDVTETWTYTATYTLVQEDLDESGVSNTVTVAATDPGGAPVSDVSDDGDDGDGNTTDDPTELMIDPGPALEAEKTITGTTGEAAGDTVTFQIAVDNQGDVTLSSITLTDTLTRADGTALALTTGPTLTSGDTDGDGNLDVTETFIYTATYDLVQADIDAGGISNSVLAEGLFSGVIPVSDVSDDGDDGDGNTTDDPTELTITPMPMIEAEKRVTASSSTVGDTVDYEITLRNTGTVTLTSLTLTDTLTRSDGTPLTLTSGPTFSSASAGSSATSLLPGGTATFTASYTIVQEDIDAGSISNTVTTTGMSPTGTGVSDVSDDPDAAVDTGPSDPTVTTFTQVSTLDLTKSVTAERRLFPTIFETTFEVTAENSGTVTQDDIQLVDDLAAFAAPATVLNATYPVTVSATGFTSGTANAGYDGVTDTNLLSTGASLAPGTTGTVTITVTYSTDAGFPSPGVNTVGGSTDRIPTLTPATAATSFVDTDGDGVPDALEPPTGDRDGDGIPDNQDYDPTGYFYCEEDGRLLGGGLITVTGGGFSQTGIGTSGPINILRDGSSGEYQFFVSAPGTYTLSWSDPSDGVLSTLRPGTPGPTDVTTLVDVLTGTTTTDPRVLGSSESGATRILADFSAAANPTYYTTFVFEAGDPFIFSNNIPFQACTPPAPLVASKAVIGRSDVRLGDLVNYQITFDLGPGGALAGVDVVDILPVGISYVPNSAAISVNGAAPVPTEPTITGQNLTWPGQTIPASGTLVVTLSGRVMPNAPLGVMTNRAYVQDATGTILSNIATADVRRVPEHVFDCSDVIGKVFDDQNRNGYHDEGEPGIPAARVVTAKGVLITTDEYGRFHVPCAELPTKIGSNFILKVDERSLPTGYRMTTENPRVVRLTAGKFAKMNFGASISRVVRVALNDAAFGQGAALTPKLDQALRNMVRKMQDEPSIIRLTYVMKQGERQETAYARLKAVQNVLKAEWRQHGHYKLNIERTVRRPQ